MVNSTAVRPKIEERLKFPVTNPTPPPQKIEQKAGEKLVLPQDDKTKKTTPDPQPQIKTELISLPEDFLNDETVPAPKNIGKKEESKKVPAESKLPTKLIPAKEESKFTDELDIFDEPSVPGKNSRQTGALDDLIREMGGNNDLDFFGDQTVFGKTQHSLAKNSDSHTIHQPQTSKRAPNQSHVTKELDLM